MSILQYSKFRTIEKFILIVLAAGAAVGFWYFESSIILRLLSLTMIILGLIPALSAKENQSETGNHKEFIALLVLYLGIFSFYNLLYGWNLPIYMLMIMILILACLVFFVLLSLDSIDKLIKKPVFNLYVFLTGLVVLEIFLSLSFWPVDPKTKTLIIVTAFYLVINLIYLSARGMLRLKKAAGYIVVAMLVLSALILTTFFSTHGH